MAENKKSFVLYADLIHTVRKMPKEKAGELLMTILAYVNDENPVVEDMVVDLVFEPIKRQMKRDLKKYESKKEQWSEAGKKSAEAKKLKKELNENQRPLTDVNSVATVSTVTVNDTVNVNDTISKGGEFNYSFVEDSWKVPFRVWVKYRTKIKPFKLQQAVEASYRELKEMSGNSALEAMKIIQYTISNEYKSLCKPSGKAEPKTNALQGTI